MNFKEYLETLEVEGLNEEIINNLVEAAEQTENVVLIDNRETPNYIAATEVEGLKQAKENAESTIAELETKIKEGSEAFDELQLYKEKASSLEGKLKEIKETDAIKSQINSFKRQPHNINDVMNFIDREKITITEEGDVLGLKEQYDDLIQTREYFFKPIDGGTQGPGKPSGSGKPKEVSIGKSIAQNIQGTFKKIEEAEDLYFK